MEVHDYAYQLAAFACQQPGFQIEARTYNTYDHMGALLADVVLQAGLNYRTVVYPRVKRILTKYPGGITTPGLCILIERYGTQELLKWRHDEKPRRFHELAFLLLEHGIFTEDSLKKWLHSPISNAVLLDLRGIGPKTVDYLKNLVGIPSVAVDRHIRTFVRNAGLPCTDYSEIKAVFEHAAVILGTSCSDFDRAVWRYVSS